MPCDRSYAFGLMRRSSARTMLVGQPEIIRVYVISDMSGVEMVVAEAGGYPYQSFVIGE